MTTVRHSNVVTTSFCKFQRRRRYFSNETPNNVSVEHRLNISMVLLHDILLEYCDDVSKGRNNDVVHHQDVSVVSIYNIPLVRLYDVFFKSQIKYSTTSLWYVSTTPQCYVFLRHLVSKSLLRFQVTLLLLPSARFLHVT